MFEIVARSGEMPQARPEELDEPPHHSVAAQHLGDGQHHVRRRRARRRCPLQAHTHDLGNQQTDRLAKHRGLRLDAADAPADDAEPVHHGRVRVGADQRVGVCLRRPVGPPAGEHHASQVLEVHLVDDASRGRHDLEVVEPLLRPAQEGVALVVAPVVELAVAGRRPGRGPGVDLDRVVDDQLDGRQRIDATRIAAERRDGVPHGGQVPPGPARP
jgi:hypothetical protein